ncbi:MAG: hypothetical protein ACM3TN_00055 [Alphaproteobacteria bacterium]
MLRDFDYRNRHKEDVDCSKAEPAPVKEPEQMTVEEWSGSYLEIEEAKTKRLYGRENS